MHTHGDKHAVPRELFLSLHIFKRQRANVNLKMEVSYEYSNIES